MRYNARGGYRGASINHPGQASWAEATNIKHSLNRRVRSSSIPTLIIISIHFNMKSFSMILAMVGMAMVCGEFASLPPGAAHALGQRRRHCGQLLSSRACTPSDTQARLHNIFAAEPWNDHLVRYGVKFSAAESAMR